MFLNGRGWPSSNCKVGNQKLCAPWRISMLLQLLSKRTISSTSPRYRIKNQRGIYSSNSNERIRKEWMCSAWVLHLLWMDGIHARFHTCTKNLGMKLEFLTWVTTNDESFIHHYNHFLKNESSRYSESRVCPLLVESPHFACVEHAQCSLLAHCVSTHTHTHTTFWFCRNGHRRPIKI